ncbi:long-chain-fatty-acid--coa ligase [Anaeramoeba flamelloides]|uniref:Long-chain-fatty-acid--coa ligase n=1 Tax=Anaeramoeba flamelloides TaxID=1746091 RepID=A0ABQ8XJS6_9EUKA|nr:long-chain-fatty-acid--coa ligase [Anaeramoeba flamelloides]
MSYMDVLNLLSTEGQELFLSVKSKGKDVRDIYSQMVNDGKKLADQIREECEGFRKKRLVLIKKMNSVDLPPIEDYLNIQEKLKQEVLMYAEKLKELNQNPPHHEEFQKKVKLFGSTLEKLQELGKNEKVRIPWQVTVCADMDPDKKGEAVTLGGAITDAQGRNLYGDWCDCCGHEIQDGAKGEGDLRWKNLDHHKISICDDCYQNRELVFQKIFRILSLTKFPTQFKLDLLKQNLNQIEEQKVESYKWALSACEKLRNFKSMWAGSLFVAQNNIDVFLRIPLAEVTSLPKAIFVAMSIYKNRPLFGYRDSQKDIYNWVNYDQIFQSTLKIALQLKKLLSFKNQSQIENEQKDLDQELPFVGICMKNRIEWIVSDFALTLSNFPSVCLHYDWGISEMEKIVNHSECSAIICDHHTFPKIIQANKNNSNLKFLILVGSENNENVINTDIKIIRWDNLLKINLPQISSFEKWEKLYINDNQEIKESFDEEKEKNEDKEEKEETQEMEKSTIKKDDKIFSLIYSSGTSGSPKGILLHQGGWLKSNNTPIFITPLVSMSYSPLAHGMDRGIVWTTFLNGGRVGFRSDKPDLVDDLLLLQPSMFVGWPPIWNDLFKRYKGDLKILKEKHINSTVEELKITFHEELEKWETIHKQEEISDITDENSQNGNENEIVKEKEEKKEKKEEIKEEETTETICKKVIQARMHKIFSRSFQLASGGSFISEEALQFMRETFYPAYIVNLYGITEVPGITSNGSWDKNNVEIKLVDVPEMGYISDEKVSRGEIYAKTTTMFKGYFRNPELTKSVITKDGFFISGDIGEIRDGKLYIIDRKSNFIELYYEGKSVWVNTSKIESMMNNSQFFNKLLLFGDRMEAYNIAIVLLKQEIANKLNDLKLNNKDEFIKNVNELKSQIVDQFKVIGQKNNLKEYQIPKGVLFDLDGWTMENGLVTPSSKLRRGKIFQKHMKNVHQEYTLINNLLKSKK